ncbi:winged helix-turn-helix transcriptional regulator [Nocardiopsis mangrovi]|uniref:Winged helix-turn-helix transcriptional regulator n=1 Tax=Nocardiopsis mangrovi TaxID=1179818 RepID=A0ABV9E1C2_9ACTN
MAHQTTGHRPGLPDSPHTENDAPSALCPVEVTLTALRGRWTTLVVRELLRGPCSFSELAGRLPVLSDKVLADRLSHLVEHGIVRRERVKAFPPRVGYALTEAGTALGPVLQAMWDWGQDHGRPSA